MVGSGETRGLIGIETIDSGEAATIRVENHFYTGKRHGWVALREGCHESMFQQNGQEVVFSSALVSATQHMNDCLSPRLINVSRTANRVAMNVWYAVAFSQRLTYSGYENAFILSYAAPAVQIEKPEFKS